MHAKHAFYQLNYIPTLNYCTESNGMGAAPMLFALGKVTQNIVFFLKVTLVDVLLPTLPPVKSKVVRRVELVFTTQFVQRKGNL